MTLSRLASSPSFWLYCIVSFIHGASPQMAVETEFCEAETFTPRCKEDEVVLIGHAEYGRMKLGKCIKTDYGYVGCGQEVLEKVANRCSGRRTCSIRIPDTDLDEAHPCPDEFKTYLEANYTCLHVESRGCSECASHQFVQLTNERGYIGSVVTMEQDDQTGCGSASCPWVIEMKPGQKINLTMYDFTTVKTQFSHGDCGMRYAVIKEENAEEVACAGKGHVSHLYTSTTNRVQIIIVSPQVFQQRGQFIFKYEALGCPSIQPPPNTWVKQNEDEKKAVITCMSTQESWTLTCEGTQWIGQHALCPEDSVHVGGSTQYGFTLPLGVLIAIIVGIALVIGVLILTIGLVCLKRYQHGTVRRPDPYSIYGRSRHGSVFHEEMSAATPLQYAKKEQQSPDLSKRRGRGNSIRENVYMESRPLPSIPNLAEVSDDTKVQVYRTSSGREHYHNPNLIVAPPPRVEHIPNDPAYFVLDPDELSIDSPSPCTSGYSSYAYKARGGVRSDKQKSPEEENAENFCKEVASYTSSCHEIPPMSSTPQICGSDNNKGNCSWP